MYVMNTIITSVRDWLLYNFNCILRNSKSMKETRRGCKKVSFEYLNLKRNKKSKAG